MAAGFRARKSSAWHYATKISLRHSGAWVEVLRIRIWKTVNKQSGWRDVYVKSGTTPTPTPSPTPSPTPTPSVNLNVVMTPNAVNGSHTGPGSCTTGYTKASASGGTPPYMFTYTRSTWSTGQGTRDAPSINVDPLDSSRANFTQLFAAATGLLPRIATGRFLCTVKDNKNNTGSGFVDATWYFGA